MATQAKQLVDSQGNIRDEAGKIVPGKPAIKSEIEPSKVTTNVVSTKEPIKETPKDTHKK